MENDRKTIEKLISSNQGFVISLASQYKHRGLEMDDLVSEGNIGMLSAARSFEHEGRGIAEQEKAAGGGLKLGGEPVESIGARRELSDM